MRVYKVHHIGDDGCFFAKRARDGHDDVGVVDAGIDFRLLFAAKRVDFFGKRFAVSGFDHSVLVTG